MCTTSLLRRFPNSRSRLTVLETVSSLGRRLRAIQRYLTYVRVWCLVHSDAFRTYSFILPPCRVSLASTTSRTEEDSHNTFLCFSYISRCLQGGRIAKGPELIDVTDELNEASPAMVTAVALDLPSPRESKRAEAHSSAVEGGVRLPPQVMQRLWAWIAYKIIVKRVGGGGGDGVSRRGRGQVTAASQVLTCFMLSFLSVLCSCFSHRCIWCPGFMLQVVYTTYGI